MRDTLEMHRYHSGCGVIFPDLPLLQKVSVTDPDGRLDHVVQYADPLLRVILDYLEVGEDLVPPPPHFLVSDRLEHDIRRDVLYVSDRPEEHYRRVPRHLLVHVHVVARAGVVPGGQVFPRYVYDLFEVGVYRLFLLVQLLVGSLGLQVERDFTGVKGVTTVVVLDINVRFSFYRESRL